jgi:hypothetical protein
LIAVNASCPFGMGDGNELLAEFFGEPLEGALFTLQDLRFVVGKALFDVIIALDHGAPESGGELAC